MTNKIYIPDKGHRASVAIALAESGYTVRIGKEKIGNRWDWFVEYWR